MRIGHGAFDGLRIAGRVGWLTGLLSIRVGLGRRIGGTELVRRVYAAVRDVDWDTVPGVVSNLEVEQGDGSFRVEFDARHARREIDFGWHGTITGDESGRIEVRFDGRAEDVLPYNRIGICVHHPWRETKAARFRARTADGEL